MSLSKQAGKKTKADLPIYVASLRKCHDCCNAAMAILADITAKEAPNDSACCALMIAGHFTWNGLSVTGRILGPTRLDGGLLLLTLRLENGDTEHRVYLIDDVYHQLHFNPSEPGFTRQVQVLIRRAVAKRDRILSQATHYFSGISGKVIKIL